MDALRIIAENKIADSLKDGEFDNLPGKGKPVQFSPQGADFDEQFLANHLLKNNGFIPDWLEERKTLLDEIQALNKSLNSSELLLDEYKVTILQLNNRISGYNLRVPVAAMQLHLFQTQK